MQRQTTARRNCLNRCLAVFPLVAPSLRGLNFLARRLGILSHADNFWENRNHDQEDDDSGRADVRIRDEYRRRRSTAALNAFEVEQRRVLYSAMA